MDKISFTLKPGIPIRANEFPIVHLVARCTDQRIIKINYQ